VRIDQLVPSFVRHDAISNHALQIRRVLRQAGFDSNVYVGAIDHRLAGEARVYFECPTRPDKNRLLLYHASTDSPMAAWLESVARSGQLVACDYHNITPSRYFARWEPPAARSMQIARRELALLAPVTAMGLADSRFNEQELIETGYRSTAVCPLLLDLDSYHQPPDRRALATLRRSQAAGGKRWLFVGRIAPNKCQHDVIAAFALYRRLFDAKSRLTFVGGATSPRYRRALERMAVELDLGDSLEFTDSVAFDVLLAYFAASDVFVCLSEHEGFCVPIIEAMELGLPVVAYSAAAVTDTVDGAGVLLEAKDPLVVACAVQDLLADESERRRKAEAGKARAAEFSLESSSKKFLETVTAGVLDSRGDVLPTTESR
jgi:L-malate glycosyltransferase